MTAGDKEVRLARAILELSAIRSKLSSLGSVVKVNRRDALFGRRMTT